MGCFCSHLHFKSPDDDDGEDEPTSRALQTCSSSDYQAQAQTATIIEINKPTIPTITITPSSPPPLISPPPIQNQNLIPPHRRLRPKSPPTPPPLPPVGIARRYQAQQSRIPIPTSVLPPLRRPKPPAPIPPGWQELERLQKGRKELVQRSLELAKRESIFGRESQEGEGNEEERIGMGIDVRRRTAGAEDVIERLSYDLEWDRVRREKMRLEATVDRFLDIE